MYLSSKWTNNYTYQIIYIQKKKGDGGVKRMLNTPIEVCKGVRKRRMSVQFCPRVSLKTAKVINK
jgi:hypothetical protein